MKSSKLKSLQFIHFALCLAVFNFGAVVFYLITSQSGLDESKATLGLFQKIVPMVIVIGMAGAYYFKKTSLRDILKERDLNQKLEKYQKAFIIEMACLEAPALLTVVASFLTGNTTFLLITIALLAVMIFRRPTKQNIQKNLELSDRDAEAL